MTWYQKFAAEAGELSIRKSDLVTFGLCPRRFRLSKEEQLGRAAASEKKVFGAALAGTAVHATLERALPYVIKGGNLDPTQLRLAYHQEFATAMKAEGIERAADISWPRDSNADAIHRAKSVELYFFLLAAPKRIKEVVAVESKFRGTIERRGTPIHTQGTVDIVFRDHEGRLCLGDYKSGKRKPTQFCLTFGHEASLYAHALREGTFVAKDGSETRYSQFPDALYVIFVQDFMPALKDSNRRVWMKTECDYWGVSPGSSVKVKKGMPRGPGWYESGCTAEQLPGFAEAVGQVVSCIRMGFFPPVLNSGCTMCRYKEPCVAEGFGLHGGEKKKLETMLAGIPEDELKAATDYGDDE